MSKSKRYIKSTKKDKDDQEREERILKLLEQKKSCGRMPVPPPGHFHENTGRRQKKERKSERVRLKDMIKEFNNE